MLDAHHLRLVVTLALHGNVIRAGRVLDMFPPSELTRAGKAVEGGLGVPRFDRSRREFEPTAICRAIIAKGSVLLEKADELVVMVAQLANAPDGADCP